MQMQETNNNNEEDDSTTDADTIAQMASNVLIALESNWHLVYILGKTLTDRAEAELRHVKQSLFN